VTVEEGDLVKLVISEPYRPGALTAIKFFLRMKKRCTPEPGLVLSIYESNIEVLFGENKVLVHKKYLEKVEKSKK
jgi:hypothetical protein